MTTRLGELVERFGGQLVGNPEIAVTSIAPLDAADVSNITFLSNQKFRTLAAKTAAAALILSPADDEAVGAAYGGARIITRNPYAYFARVAQYFAAMTHQAPSQTVHPTATVDPGAKIAATATIGPNVTVEADAEIGEHAVVEHGCFVGRGAKIGAHTHLYPRVVFMEHCEIGERCIIHPGAVIGTEGFGFANDGGKWIKIPQTGRVMIGNDVQIGANTTIDRGALVDTVIDEGVKLDNQIQIGHNCHIGAHTAMAGCVGLAGSTKIGKYCTLGGRVGVTGHVTIADNVHISAAGVVSRSITEPGQYAGYYPLAKQEEWHKSASIVRNLDAMRDRVRELEKLVKALTEKQT